MMMELQKDSKASNEQMERIWALADKLRAELDSTSYKEHILQLLFLKQISSQADLDVKLFEPKKLHNTLEHRLTYYQLSNGGMSNDNK